MPVVSHQSHQLQGKDSGHHVHERHVRLPDSFCENLTASPVTSPKNSTKTKPPRSPGNVLRNVGCGKRNPKNQTFLLTCFQGLPGIETSLKSPATGLVGAWGLRQVERAPPRPRLHFARLHISPL